MLNEAGRIVGEFTVARATDADEFHLFGSLPAEVHHSRWFRHHLPADGSVRFEVLGLGLDRAVGGRAAVAGRARGRRAGPRPLDRGVPVHDVPARRPRDDPGPPRPDQLRGRPRATSCGSRPSTSARCSTGSWPPARTHGLRLFGMRALMSLRLEKSYGTWFREYRPIYTIRRGRARAVRPARPRLHRPGGVRGRGRRGRAGAAARRVRRRPRPGRPGRRHRRRADLARRRRSSAG